MPSKLKSGKVKKKGPESGVKLLTLSAHTCAISLPCGLNELLITVNLSFSQCIQKVLCSVA